MKDDLVKITEMMDFSEEESSDNRDISELLLNVVRNKLGIFDEAEFEEQYEDFLDMQCLDQTEKWEASIHKIQTDGKEKGYCNFRKRKKGKYTTLQFDAKDDKKRVMCKLSLNDFGEEVCFIVSYPFSIKSEYILFSALCCVDYNHQGDMAGVLNLDADEGRFYLKYEWEVDFDKLLAVNITFISSVISLALIDGFTIYQVLHNYANGFYTNQEKRFYSYLCKYSQEVNDKERADDMVYGLNGLRKREDKNVIDMNVKESGSTAANTEKDKKGKKKSDSKTKQKKDKEENDNDE